MYLPRRPRNSRGFKSPLNSWVFEEDTLFGQLALLAEDSYLS